MRKFWHFKGGRGELFRNAGLVASGTLIAQAVNFVGYAVSTRFLSPSEFGVFAAHVAISSPLAILATGRYEAVFLRANSHSRIINLLALCVCCSIVFSLVVVGVISFSFEFFEFLSKFNLYALFVLIIGQSLLNIFTQLANFNHQYRAIGFARVAGAFLTQFAVILMAINGGGANSLSFGLALGMLTSVAFLLRGNCGWMKDNIRFISVSRSRGVGRRYRDLAIFNAPQALASAFQDTFAIAIITVQFGPSAAGLYALNNRLLRAPISIFAESIGRVLQRYFSDLGSLNAVSRVRERRRSLNEAVVGAAALGFVLFGIAWALGPAVADYLFSDQWSELGGLIRAAAPYYGAHLAAATLIAIPVAAGAKYRLLSIFGVFGSALYVASFGLAGLLTANIVGAFHFVSAIMAGYFLMLIFYIYRITRARIGAVN
ncbi:lipopolysaccharide biosynthesis protein [Rhizobium rosettiformans]|uniref:lipopolysaccharide biosynthesis protein n=1 Tax=Rhizobium rosettiformans TaxID=1368430 RepID=UPI00285890E8|nr:oligosaccharide flippase family protein [Rhizobium rosettiformans]MDR7028995.1 O-antigen/teichoic acid export membrane protein [Rhizobium rosettiformans]MDR7063723.1 O-antigen/teichoic acid export membrane protein [Rhizobium rosettiformans]